MALVDILKSRKREEVKPERLPKGALKQIEKPAKKREEIKIAAPKKKKETKRIKKEEISKEESKVKIKQSTLAAELLLQPHITEQSNLLAQKNVYTFRVNPRANKILIKKAIQEMYGFKPVKIRIINTHSKKRVVRGKKGMKPGFKKALVYLKEGDKIEFI
jgi:large subunit ribosomal protein L23